MKNTKCALLGCEKSARLDYESPYCGREHAFIASHIYVGETLAEYIKRKLAKGRASVLK